MQFIASLVGFMFICLIFSFFSDIAKREWVKDIREEVKRQEEKEKKNQTH